jgi:Putative transposase
VRPVSKLTLLGGTKSGEAPNVGSFVEELGKAAFEVVIRRYDFMGNPRPVRPQTGPEEEARSLNRLAGWVSLGGPEQVLRYLANYSHRVAISNHRILSVADGNVTFRWKDYAHGNSKKVMTLAADGVMKRNV